MSAPIRIGIVGAGAIAQAYAVAIGTCPDIRLTAVADTNVAAAAALAKDSDAAAFSSHLELADSGACDAVIVATPPATHETVVVDLIERDLPVLCEKPFAIDYASARRMVAAATEQGVLVSMASKFRYVADVQRARERIAAGEIGEIKLIENVFTGVVDMTGRWNAQAAISGGGVLIDNGTHSVDIVRFLAGPIRSVSAMKGPRIQPLDVEDHVFLFARTDSGALAKIETSWSLHKDRPDYFGIYGTEGAIELGWKGSRIRRPASGPWEAFGSGYDKVAAFANQVSDFASGVRGDATRYLATLDDVFSSVDVVSAGYTSIAEASRWIDVLAATSVYQVHPRGAAS